MIAKWEGNTQNYLFCNQLHPRSFIIWLLLVIKAQLPLLLKYTVYRVSVIQFFPLDCPVFSRKLLNCPIFFVDCSFNIRVFAVQFGVSFVHNGFRDVQYLVSCTMRIFHNKYTYNVTFSLQMFEISY